jgi:hypothetical protein
MDIEIARHEAEEIERSNGWILLYGRRKTGKTYLLKNFTTWNSYFLVRKDGTVTLDESGTTSPISPPELARLAGDRLRSGKIVIVDEFQRLPSTFLDDIATYHPKGKLILTGSSFRVMKDVFGSNSPVLGLLAEHKIGLADPADIISSLSKTMTPEKTIEFSAFARDPWIIPHLFFEDSVQDLFRITKRFPNAITGLVGEVFQEEERTYTQLYEAILRLLGAGYSKSDEIASILSSRGIIKNGTTSAIIPMINNMEAMDLVMDLPIYGSKRKKTYLLKSPIFEMFFRLADRYDIENRDVEFEEVEETVKMVRNIAIQRFVGEIFAKKYGGTLEYSFDPEIDFIVTKKGKPMVAGEVKWGKYDKSDLARFAENVSNFDCPKIFVTKEKGATMEGIEIFDPLLISKLLQKKR